MCMLLREVDGRVARHYVLPAGTILLMIVSVLALQAYSNGT